MRLRYSRLLIFLGLFFLSTAHATIENTGLLSKVKLVATLNGQPAMQEAVWRIYSPNDPVTPVAILPRHSGMIFLAPGIYRAVVTLKWGGVYALQFRVETDADNLVKVAVH